MDFEREAAKHERTVFYRCYCSVWLAAKELLKINNLCALDILDS